MVVTFVPLELDRESSSELETSSPKSLESNRRRLAAVAVAAVFPDASKASGNSKYVSLYLKDVLPVDASEVELMISKSSAPVMIKFGKSVSKTSRKLSAWYVLNASWNPSSSHTEVSTSISSHS